MLTNRKYRKFLIELEMRTRNNNIAKLNINLINFAFQVNCD